MLPNDCFFQYEAKQGQRWKTNFYFSSALFRFGPFLAEIFSPIFSRVESINNNNNNDYNNDDNKNNNIDKDNSNIDKDNSNNDDNSSINDDKQAFRATDVKVT